MTEKQSWCVLLGINLSPTGIGKIEKIEGNCFFVKYSENQQFPADAWDGKNVKPFQTSQEALVFFKEEYKELFFANFPSQRH